MADRLLTSKGKDCSTLLLWGTYQTGYRLFRRKLARYCAQCRQLYASVAARFFTSAINDFPKCDLLIIIGTSLVVCFYRIQTIVMFKVQPFASMIHEVAEDVPRLLINLEEVGKVSGRDRSRGAQGLDYGEADNTRDVFWKGTADEGIWELAELLNLKDELHQMVDAGWKAIDDRLKASATAIDDKLKAPAATGASDKGKS